MFAPIMLFLATAMQNSTIDPTLLTVAEKSEYTETSTSAQVMELIDRLRERDSASILRAGELGRTVEGKPIPLMFLANPPVENVQNATAASATRGVPIAFIMANIHAGEVEGKEACLMLARELALDSHHPLLKDLIIIIAPNYNADGNDKFDDAAKNRPGQVGPNRCGVRPNSQGLDLNRDYIKLEAPETRSLVKFLDECDPHITIDCHTTNGSHHRYVLTYDAPLNPSGHAGPIEFVRNDLLPAVTKRVRDRTGYDTWFYGNFDAAHKIWATYSAEPRFGANYQGLRGQMTVLSEAYSYATFKDRVLATREFVREILMYVAENKSKVMEIHQRARRETLDKGANPQPSDVVGIRHRIAAFNTPTIVKGYELTPGRGGVGGAAITAHDDLGAPKDYEVVHLGRFEPTLSVARPHAYIAPPLPGMDAILDKLRQHGIEVREYGGRGAAAECEVYTITNIERAAREFQGHREVSVEVTAKRERREIPKGSNLISTAQPRGTLVVYLLEPQSEDGLVTWNFFDPWLEIGKEFPVWRVRAGGVEE